MSYGQKSHVGISFQNSFGTLLQNSVYWVPFLTEGVGEEKPQLISENMRGIFDEGDHYEGVNAAPGELEVEAEPIALGVMLKAVFGDPVSVQSNAMYTHTFKPTTADFDVYASNVPVTYEKYMDDGGSATLFYDLVGNMLELSVANGEFLKAKVGFVGGRSSQQAAATPSYPDTKKWTWDVASVSIGGAAKPEFNALTVTVEENTEPGYTFNTSKAPSRVKRTGMRVISVAGTLKFDDQIEYQEFRNQSERAFLVHFEGVNDVASGYKEALTVELPLLRYSENKPVVGGPGEVEVSISGKGVYSIDSATALQITLVNTQPAY